MHEDSASSPTLDSADTVRVWEILYIDDNRGDIELVAEALEATGLPHRLHVAEQGDAAFDFIYRKGPYTDVPRPDIMLLDWNMPKYNGRDMLHRFKSDERLASIPIIVFTSSASPANIREAYEAGANCYIIKPVDLDQFLNVAQRIQLFWTRSARLPYNNQ